MSRTPTRLPICLHGDLFCWYLNYAPSILAASVKHHTSQTRVAGWMFASTMTMYGLVGCVAGILLPEAPTNIGFYKYSQSSQEEPSIETLVYTVVLIPAIDVICNSSIQSCPTYERERANHCFLRIANSIPSRLQHDLIRKL